MSKEYIVELGEKAKEASRFTSMCDTKTKNELLIKCANALREHSSYILEINSEDLINAEKAGRKKSFLDRLALSEKRIEDMASGLKEVAELPDPVGEILSMKTMPNGMIVGQKRVPMGVIGIIFEARPNVTSDAFGLCFKAGSATILRGGSEALKTNSAIVNVFRRTLKDNGVDENIVTLVEDTDYETAKKMMCLNKYIDVLIPRGSATLIKTVVQNSTVPFIETGVGNCHVYVDESADLDMAEKIVINAKTQRPGVCNACETLLVHERLKDSFVPRITNALLEAGVEVRGDKDFEVVTGVKRATDEDFATEFEDYIISARTVPNFDEAIEHIRKYSSGHSDCIVTENYTSAQRFLNEIDSSCVYVNASTRFTDGNQFGLGAEIGISTQKLHARGPMGLKELCTTKYIIFGAGQIRE
ncbi:MAG: glutamate-5-semialdehyde dehydrogenase [Synergistaceae bacterium]